uniref:Cytochrome c-type biogenesis protein CcmH n=1 Tax=Candidatus Kentrum sp. LPFa TaxID=2126335 RepID=A0A450VR28_9GAMM|nr:MAG: cytochrome c-type biogenesis protein CcmH [Candidatus Kentron sp. LPFa]VFK23969.1 MAG: cytochrome c-type biogenesis protein CcmH [Candidatus Kentron sp. LPFa]
MGTFLFITTIMTGIGLGFVLPGILGRGGRVAADRGRLNAAIYRERISDLERQYREKRIDDAEFARFGDEIRRAALSDLEGEGALAAKRDGARTDRWVAALVAIAVPMVAFGLYFQLGSPILLSTMPDAARMDHEGGQGSLQRPSVEEMVTRLASRLREDPDNPEGWLILARSYMALGRMAEARASFAEALKRWPDNPEVLVGYAKLLARENKGAMAGRPMELVQSALRVAPDFPAALWLAGIAAYQRNDYAGAIEYWERLQKKGGLDEREQRMLAELLAEARKSRVAESKGASD